MAKYCPEKDGYVLYLDCIECETKSCEKQDNNARLVVTSPKGKTNSGNKQSPSYREKR